MQYPPSGQNRPSQEQPSYGYGQPSQSLPSNTQWGPQAPSQPLPPNTQWGQQPYPPQQGQWQQPPQQHPPMFQPPQQPKKKSKLPIIIGVVVALVVFACIGSALASKGGTTTTTSTDTTTTQSTQQQPTSAPTTAPTPTPTPRPLKWTTVQTFTGNGNKKTAIFNTPDDWKIVWSCDPSSFYGGEYNLIVSVYGSDGSDVDLAAINTICKAGNTHDLTEEHQGGQVYLDIASEGAWTIQIQELK